MYTPKALTWPWNKRWRISTISMLHTRYLVLNWRAFVTLRPVQLLLCTRNHTLQWKLSTRAGQEGRRGGRLIAEPLSITHTRRGVSESLRNSRRATPNPGRRVHYLVQNDRETSALRSGRLNPGIHRAWQSLGLILKRVLCLVMFSTKFRWIRHETHWWSSVSSLVYSDVRGQRISTCFQSELLEAGKK